MSLISLNLTWLKSQSRIVEDGKPIAAILRISSNLQKLLPSQAVRSGVDGTICPQLFVEFLKSISESDYELLFAIHD
jgi:hypothetical protein